jgi:hypothetical protein
MKKMTELGLCALLFITVSLGAYSQDVSSEEEGNYVKRNIALTKFKMLGVSAKQYAKCVESVNYQDPVRKLKAIVIDKTEYADDGENYDRVANDGIMTSTTLFFYSDGQTVAAPGQYLEAKKNVIVHDLQFEHLQSLRSAEGKFGITIACDVFWRDCNSWPPELQSFCRRMSWPFSGSVVIRNCRIEIEF